MSLSLLGLLNLVSPKASASRRVRAGIAYGTDPRQRLDLYRPVVARAALPAILFIYGGSWNFGDRRDYAFAARRLAAAGYLVAVPDYRLVPQVEYPAFLEDCAAAFRWLADNAPGLGGDAERMALMGHSAGAYNAAMLALEPAYLGAVRARVRALVGLSGPYDFYPFDVQVTRRTFGAVRDPARTQPVNLVSATAPPAFLATGAADTLVYPRNTVALARLLREAGVAVEERHYPGLSHAQTLLDLGSGLGGRSSLLADLVGFLARHLGD